MDWGNKEQVKAYNRQYYLDHKERSRELSRAWRQNNPDKNKANAKSSFKKYYDKNKDSLLENTQKWRENNKEHLSAYEKRWRESPECKEAQKRFEDTPKRKRWHKEKHLKKSYGITIEQLEQMRTSQNNRCAICQREFILPLRACVDHCHTTGRVRELLCQYCNLAIGNFGEDVSRLLKAIGYINKWKGGVDCFPQNNV